MEPARGGSGHSIAGVLADGSCSAIAMSRGSLHRGLLFAGAFLFATGKLALLVVLFALAGIYIAVVDALEGVITADLVTPETRGTAYGMLGTVNGVGDLASSTIVGALWALHPTAGFVYAAVLMQTGAMVLVRVR